MILVHVDLVKNSRSVVGLYKINKVSTAIITTVATAIAIFFLDLFPGFIYRWNQKLLEGPEIWCSSAAAVRDDAWMTMQNSLTWSSGPCLTFGARFHPTAAGAPRRRGRGSAAALRIRKRPPGIRTSTLGGARRERGIFVYFQSNPIVPYTKFSSSRF